MFTEPETWVAIAFVLLFVLFGYLGIHRTLLKALDHRAERIKAELDEARRLKDDAAKLLAEYKAKRSSAEPGIPLPPVLADNAAWPHAVLMLPAVFDERA